MSKFTDKLKVNDLPKEDGIIKRRSSHVMSQEEENELKDFMEKLSDLKNHPEIALLFEIPTERWSYLDKLAVKRYFRNNKEYSTKEV